MVSSKTHHQPTDRQEQRPRLDLRDTRFPHVATASVAHTSSSCVRASTKFRREKNAQIAKLQRANADASQTIKTLRRSDAPTLRRTKALQRQNLQLLEKQSEDKISSMEQLQNQAALS